MTVNPPGVEAEAQPASPRDKTALPREWFERSDAKGLSRLGLHLGVLAGTAALLASTAGTIGWLSAMIVHGVVLTFLFSPLHECIHSTAFKSRWLNNGVARACGFLLLLPREYFRAFHLEHHRFTQNPDRDPELRQRKPASRSELLLHLSGLPYWRERVTTLLRHARGEVTESFIAENMRPRIVREARWHLACYGLAAVASLAGQSAVLLSYWIFPAFLGQPFLRAFLLAEHTGCPEVPNMLVNTRTTISNPIVRGLSWNMPYHAEHHAWAAVPFHHLPRVHQRTRDEITYLSRGYLEVHRDLWRKLKSSP